MKKSIQAIIITTVIGLIIPRLISLSDVGIINKLAWKGLLGGAFSLATLIVGILYSCHLLHGKVSGGKARISIFIVAVLVLCVSAPAIATIIGVTTKVIIAIIATAIAIAMIFGIYKLISWFRGKTNHNIISPHQQTSNDNIKVCIPATNQRNLTEATQCNTTNLSQKAILEVHQNKIVNDQPIQAETKKEIICTLDRERTLYELAMEHDFSTGCMTVTNDENPDLKWVKIYKSWYANGKFYGYIMMNNAHRTVNREIYFADRPIWRLA